MANWSRTLQSVEFGLGIPRLHLLPSWLDKSNGSDIGFPFTSKNKRGDSQPWEANIKRDLYLLVIQMLRKGIGILHWKKYPNPGLISSILACNCCRCDRIDDGGGIELESLILLGGSVWGGLASGPPSGSIGWVGSLSSLSLSLSLSNWNWEAGMTSSRWGVSITGSHSAWESSKWTFSTGFW